MRSLIPWGWGEHHGSSSGGLLDLHRDLDSLFESVFGPMDRRGEERGGWWPSVEAHQANDKLTVRCDLPGVDPKDVEVSLEGDTLTISGERRTNSQREEDGGRYSEMRYGRFERVLRVPDGLDPEKVTARYASGVLEITAPLPKDRGTRKVAVQIGQGEGPKQAA